MGCDELKLATVVDIGLPSPSLLISVFNDSPAPFSNFLLIISLPFALFGLSHKCCDGVFAGVAAVVVAKTCGFDDEISTAALFTNPPLLIEFDEHPIAFDDGLFDAAAAATTDAELVIWSRIAWYELNICFIIVDDFNAWKSCSVLLLVDSPFKAASLSNEEVDEDCEDVETHIEELVEEQSDKELDLDRTMKAT